MTELGMAKITEDGYLSQKLMCSVIINENDWHTIFFAIGWERDSGIEI